MGGDVAAAAGPRVATCPVRERAGRAAPGRGTSHSTARARRGSVRPARSRAGRSGLDHRPSMYASPAPVSPPTRIRVSASRSWIRISAASAGVVIAERPDGAVRQHDSEPSDADPFRRRRAPRATPGDRASLRLRGGEADRVRTAHRATSRWRWKWAPRSHSRSACQWMRAVVRCGRNGWRSDQPKQVPVGQPPPRQVQAGVQLEALGLALVDRDPQPRRLVADPHLVAAVQAR